MHRTRAVSTTLSYVLTLAIATILITGLIIAGGSYVDAQRDQVIRDELTVVGQQLAADLERADRLVRAGDSPSNMNVAVNQSFSNTVTGASYTVTVGGSGETLILAPNDPDLTVRVGVSTKTAIETPGSAIQGGDVQVSYDASSRTLEVEHV